MPQSVEAATELREIAAVPLQIVSPRESVPIVSVVQDTLVGANRFTRSNVLFTKKEVMNLLVHAKRWNGKLPEPITSEPQPMWSGQQLLSALLPPVNLSMKNSSDQLVSIQSGTIKEGILDKSVFSKQLLHIIYNDYGHEMAVDFLDSLQAMIASFLMNSGFSVGISDLIADEDTNEQIQVSLKELTKKIEDQILQLHTGLFENSSGRSNQEEFESKIMQTLNKVVNEAGKIGVKALADTNRMTNMIKAGSKGSEVNVSQMIATLGQQAIEGKRVPNGFQHRTLPHFKRFDDSAQARGFIASSYIKGLQPDEFFFHAMSGREGLIDTAVKSVTGETPVVVMENNVTKCVPIGPWIDAQLDAAKDRVEHFEERDMELLNLDAPIYIPTADEDGRVTWGEITAITRHDPGKELYEIKTAAGKSVIVTESKSLLIYNDQTKKFERMSTPDVRPGHYVPVTMNLPVPPTLVSSVSLPSNKLFEFTYDNGVFIGLYLADSVRVETDTIQITNNNTAIQSFVTNCMKYEDQAILAKFLTAWVGHGAAHKRVPAEAFAAPEDFIKGLLNGYFSGDGSVSDMSIDAGSASKELIDGISMLCTRLGVFAKISQSQLKSNNVGTETIAPTYRIAIRAQWAARFASQITLLDEAKEKRLRALAPTESHRNFTSQNDVVLDRIEEINIVDVAKYPKVYDLTVPSTLNFGLANGLHVVDTADTGYMQRQIRVALEDLITQHDGSVRDATGNLLQIAYGEDGINATKLESQPLPLANLSDDDIRAQFAAPGAAGEQAYIAAVMEDRRMVVEQVFLRKPQRNVRYPVHLDRIIESIHYQFNLTRDAGTVTATEVLDAQEKILARTHRHNKLWAALVHYHLSPLAMRKWGYTTVALEALVEQVVLKHWKSWVEPGQPVGVIAAQSIGEPATQMSMVYDTKIVINTKDGQYNGPIGAYIDTLLNKHASRVVDLGDDSVVLDMDTEACIVGVSTDEKTSWLPIQQVSRHPAHGGLVQVTTRTGRTTTATLSHSFLKRGPAGIEAVRGSDLHVGDRIPVASHIPQVRNPIASMTAGKTTYALDREFGWVCGMYVADGCLPTSVVSISKMDDAVESALTAFATRYGYRFSSIVKQGEYGPNKDNIIHSSELREFLDTHFGHGSFGKRVADFVFHAPTEFIAGFVGGYFDGDGNVNVDRQQIRLSSRNSGLIRDTNRLIGYLDMFGWMGEERSVRAPGAIQYTLNIPKSLAAQFATVVGFKLPKKAESLTQILAHVNRADKHATPEYIDKIPAVGDILAATGELLGFSDQSRTFGRWAKKESIGRATLRDYIARAKDGLVGIADAAKAAQIQANIAQLESAANSHVLWDEIVELKLLDDPQAYVYDFTVPGNDSFMVDDNILVHNTLNTFHLAGVAAKSNMTRGVPRLKELLKVTKKPKAVELTIPLRHDLREKKEEARRVTQELEFTLLQDLVTISRIYYDPRDNATLIGEDADWLAYLAAFENAQSAASGGAPVVQPADPLAIGGGAGGAAAEVAQQPKQSPWILRFELDRDRMFAKNITMDDIAFVLKTKFNGILSTIYSDYNSNRLVFRLRLNANTDPIDDLNTLKSLQNKVLSSTAIRGIPGLRAVNYQKVSDIHEFKDGKYTAIDQYILTSDGSNFGDVIAHPDVDPTRVVSSNVHDMFENLGIEATRATLFKEITTLFQESGSSVNYRHVCVLIDKMCHKGRLMSIDRFGINKNDIGPLAKMSFEQTEDIALRAAIFGERDPVLGVSAKVMLGAPIRAGTAFSNILMDEAAAFKLAASTPDQHPVVKEGPGRYDEEFEEDEEPSVCNTVVEELKLNMNIPVLPTLESIAEEAELGEVEIAVVE